MQPWKRTYRVVLVANLITSIGMMSFLPFFPSYLAGMGLTDRDEIAAWSGLIFGAAPFTAAFMAPIWGSVGDRYGRKAMVLRALIAIMLFVGLMGYAATPLQLLILRIGQGFFSGFVPPSITLVSISAPADQQGRVTGSLQSALAAGSILGPLLGAFVHETLGIRSIFWIVSIASGLAALLIGLFAREDASLRLTLERFSPGAVLGHAWQDLHGVFKHPNVRIALAALFLVQFGVGATNPLLELFVGDLLGDNADVERKTAFLFTSLAFATLVATPFWGRIGDHAGHRRIVLWTSLGTAVALLAHAVLTIYAGILAARICIGLFASGTSVAAISAVGSATPTERRGGAMGAVFSSRALALSLGAISGGTISAVIGIEGLFLVSGTLIAVPCLWALLRRGETRKVLPSSG